MITIIAGVLGGLASIVATTATVVAVHMQVKNSDAERRIRELEKNSDLMSRFLKTVHVYRDIASDVVVVGPRRAGKTALVKSLTEFWRPHRDLEATTEYEMHEFYFPKPLIRPRAKPVGRVSIDVWMRARVRLWDYGGELPLFERAMVRIEAMHGCLLLLVLNGDPAEKDANARFFSTESLARLATVLRKAKIDRAMVIFTKADLLDPADRTPEHMAAEHPGCMQRIHEEFADPEIFVLSAVTGDGVPAFLQRLSAEFVDGKGIPRLRGVSAVH